jgi:ABC-2 type transport system ATP-binding protein
VTESDLTIEVENLVKRFGRVVAVNDISFTVRRGEIIGFLGPNGAGKSTTMRILTGYLPATRGVVRICGKPVAATPAEIKRRIGYMPENNPLHEDMRVRDYLRWRGRLKGLHGRRLRERLDDVLRVCDLERAERRIIGHLSKGFRQRVGVADAVLAEPDVIIMDEPTIGLDPHQIILIRDLIASLRGRMSVLISSHILPEIEATCDRVIIINHGRIVASGSPAELRREFIDQTTYEVEVAGDFALVQEALAPLGAHHVVERDGALADDAAYFGVRVTAPTDRDYGADILRALGNASGVRVRALRRDQAALEEVFLAATRRSHDTVVAAGRAPERARAVTRKPTPEDS